MVQIFEYFLSVCSKLFDGKFIDRGFTKSAPVSLPPECSIAYKAGEITINIIFEYDSYPWIVISTHRQSKGLHVLIRKTRKKALKTKKGLTPEEKIEDALVFYANELDEELFKLILNLDKKT